MDYVRLGGSGLKVSRMSLGAMVFGQSDVGCDEATSLAIMDRAVERGINLIDTADAYGNGASETIVGRWLGDRGARERIVLATKFRRRTSDGPNGEGASRFHIVRAAEASLRRLGTDRIDLYQVHLQDVDTEEEETLRALDDLVRAGKVVYAGASNYAAYRLSDALWTSRLHGIARYVSLQAQYSLLVRDLEREHVPLLTKHGVGLLVWSPLAFGFLTGKYAAGPAGGRLDVWKARYDGLATPRNLAILKAVEEVAAAVGASMAEVSLAWLLAKPHVTSVTLGVRSVDQLETNARAATIALPPEQVALLDRASAPDLGHPYDLLRSVQGRW